MTVPTKDTNKLCQGFIEGYDKKIASRIFIKYKINNTGYDQLYGLYREAEFA
jgi:hypothetical protein